MDNYIIQGSNSPIKMEFDEDMSGISFIEVSLWDKNGKELKHWSKDDLKIEVEEILAPLKQSETLGFPHGNLILEVKCLDDDDIVVLFERETITCVDRFDETILGGI